MLYLIILEYPFEKNSIPLILESTSPIVKDSSLISLIFFVFFVIFAVFSKTIHRYFLRSHIDSPSAL